MKKKIILNLDKYKRQLKIKFTTLEKIKLKYLKTMEHYIFYQIDNVNQKLPNLNDERFAKQIIKSFISKRKI